jgi:hypothetical protein
MKASFSHLQLADFEGCLARKVCFQIFNVQFLRDVSQKLRFHIFSFQTSRDVSHESFAFTSLAFRL